MAMKTSKEWFEQLMAEKNVTAYGAGKLVGLTPNAAYSYISGRRAFDPYTATRVAELLGVEPVLVIASAEAERAKDSERRAYWERMGGTAAGIALVCLVATGVFESDALAYSAECMAPLCIMVNATTGQIAVAAQVFMSALLTLFLVSEARPGYRHRS
jgi:hypothetical protein